MSQLPNKQQFKNPATSYGRYERPSDKNREIHRHYDHSSNRCSAPFSHPSSKKRSGSKVPVPRPRTKCLEQCSQSPKQRSHRRYPTNFCSTLRRTPPSVPPSLLKFSYDHEGEKSTNFGGQTVPNTAKKKDNIGPGRVKVMLRVCSQRVADNQLTNTKESQNVVAHDSILRVEGNRKHITILDSENSSQTAHLKVGVSAPKVYAFDAVFPEDISQAEVCSTSLVDVIHAVIHGADGAIFCYGHSGLGKTYTLLGQDDNTQNIGLIPCAISWMYRAIEEMKEKTKGRFSVRVSAIEVFGRSEQLNDLLKEFSKDDGPPDELCVREDPLYGTQLQNQCELRASSVEKAAHMLDAALAARSSSGANSTEEARRHSHMVYTLHLYQYRLDKSGKTGVSGGRSRLHLIDLGSCERTLVKTPSSLTLSLNSLGHVIMAIINNSKHVPFKESKLTLILQELLGNFNCRTVMIAHVARSSIHYAETMSTIQMASRIHRVILKKKKSSERNARDGGHRIKPFRQSHKGRTTDEESLGTSSSLGETSGSEVSCDTVIYVRPNGGLPFSDRELTDNEGPPVSVPIRLHSPPTKVLLSKIPETQSNKHFPTSPHDPRSSRQQNAETKKKCPYKLQTGESDVTQAANRKTWIKHPSERDENQHARRLGTRSKAAKTNDEPRTAIVNKQSRLKQPGSVNSRSKRSTTSASSRSPRSDPSGTYQTDTSDHDVSIAGSRWKSNTSQQRSSISVEERRVEEKGLQITKEVFPSKLRRIVHGAEGQNAENELSFIPHHSRDDATTMKSVIVNGREEPDGCDGNIEKGHHPRKSLESPRKSLESYDGYSSTKTNLSKSKQFDRKSTELSRCLRELEDVLQTVSKPSEDSSGATDYSRPGSMFVNVNEEEWKKESDDLDESVKDDNSEADGDVVDVNFYCLSFTTKNPLVPLSKNTFVRQVSNRKRQSLEEQNDCAKIMDMAKTKAANESEEHAENCAEDFVGRSRDANQGKEHTRNECVELKRSDTFVVDSNCEEGQWIQQHNADIENDSLPSKSNYNIDYTCREGKPLEQVSPNESSLVSHHSTISSPSQVLLYDSSSLEINYIKPKSLSFSRKPANCSGIGKPTKANARSQSVGYVRNGGNSKPDPSNTLDRKGCDTTVVMGTKSPDKNSTQLSLVKTEGAKSTLELVIAGTRRDDQGYAEPTVSKKSFRAAKSKQPTVKKNTPKHESAKAKSTNSSKLKWTGLKRFVGNESEDKERQPGDTIPTPNLPKTRRPSKQGNNEHEARSSATTSFVSKLLSPKLKRGQKSPFSTSKSPEFRYRSPNAINQMRHDIVRTNPPVNSGTTSISTILQRSAQQNQVPKESQSTVRGEAKQATTRAKTKSTHSRFGFIKSKMNKPT